MKIIQHYAQGAKHKAYDVPCEDRTYSLQLNGVTAIALADGAGGKKYTHASLGAECVTKAISEFLCNNFDKFYNMRDTDEMKKIFTAVCQRSLKQLAEEEGIDDIVRLASTLLVVAAKGTKALVCHIGDGVIGKITEKATRVVSAPENGEFANHTFFISSPSAEEHVTIQKCKTDSVVSYFLMSDGTAEYVFDEEALRFHDSARKMSLLAIEDDGEQKLAETIQNYMIQPDPMSDDCSFIAMVFEEKVKSVNVGLAEKKYEGLEEKPQTIIFEESFPEQEEDVEEESAFTVENFKKHKVVAIIMAVVLVLAVVLCVVLARSGDKKEEIIEQTATTSQKVETTVADRVVAEEIIDEDESEETTTEAETEGTSKYEEKTTKEVSTAAESATTKKEETSSKEKTTVTTTKPTTSKPTTMKPVASESTTVKKSKIPQLTFPWQK